MAAIARAIARAFPTRFPTELEVLQQLALVCGAGLFVWLLSLTYGLDLSPGFL
jgi:hypothetical protein